MAAAELRRRFDAIVEGVDGEAIVFGERIDHARQRSPCRHDLPAAHAAGAIQHEDDIAAHRLPCLRNRRNQRQQERALRTVAVGLQRQRRDQPILSDAETQDKIAVEPFAGLQAEQFRIVVLTFDDGVQTAAEIARLQRRQRHLDGQAQPHRIGKAGQQHRRTDARGVGHGVGVRSDAAADHRARQRHTGDVARRHHQRKAKRRLAVAVRQRSRQRQPHRRLFARRQIADAHREHARPLLFGDRRPMPLLNGLLVLLPRRSALLQLALDDAPGHLQAKARHRRAIRQRKDVRRLQRLGVRVNERLCQHCPRDQAVDARLHVQRLER